MVQTSFADKFSHVGDVKYISSKCAVKMTSERDHADYDQLFDECIDFLVDYTGESHWRYSTISKFLLRQNDPVFSSVKINDDLN